jgi:hypothetical protein
LAFLRRVSPFIRHSLAVEKEDSLARVPRGLDVISKLIAFVLE